MKLGVRRLLRDLYNLRFAGLGLAIYYLTVHFLFNQFCPMMILIHMPCPGCGMTRALVLVLTGQWTQAWQLHPLIYGWIVFGIGFVIDRYVRDKKSTYLRIFLIVLLLGTLILYGYRMVNGFPPSLR
ncbi:MAG: DUF2752 domain-containing protein [Lachnospiraceae bacterium]|nr:DUF2752 domain-containing protein [Lachnospiraceae bacterium]